MLFGCFQCLDFRIKDLPYFRLARQHLLFVNTDICPWLLLVLLCCEWQQKAWFMNQASCAASHLWKQKLVVLSDNSTLVFITEITFMELSHSEKLNLILHNYFFCKFLKVVWISTNVGHLVWEAYWYQYYLWTGHAKHLWLFCLTFSFHSLLFWVQVQPLVEPWSKLFAGT
jgi:hypothetical protein